MPARLDEFSATNCAAHSQEHDRWATAKLLHCNEKTGAAVPPLVLDLLSEILMVGLMVRLDSIENSCQGESGTIDASDCEDGKLKVGKMSTLALAI